MKAKRTGEDSIELQVTNEEAQMLIDAIYVHVDEYRRDENLYEKLVPTIQEALDSEMG